MVSMQSHSKIPEYNVLVLGETQSGKSTFVEAAKKYADQSRNIDERSIGTGYGSHTTTVNISPVVTDLPDYVVNVLTKGNKTSGQPSKVDYGEFVHTQGEDDYEDSLNQRRGIEMIRGPTKDERVRFNFIDTPGLNATTGEDELHVEKIFSALIKSKEIHLVLITISFGPFSLGFKDAIKCYIDMFPDFNGIIAFVHTHIDYKNLHPRCTKFAKSFSEKMLALNEIMCRKTVPHFKIDCDLFTKKPIRNCITQNTIQKILQLAMLNNPVVMNQTVVNKTRKMRDIDHLLKDKYEATTSVIERTLRIKNQDEGDLLAKTFQFETDIIKMDVEDALLREFLRRNNTDGLELLFEGRFDTYTMDRAASKEQSMGFEEQEFIIDKLKLLERNVPIKRHIGGENEKSWKICFEPTPRQDCVLHAKLYTARSNRYQGEIENKLAQSLELEDKMKVGVAKRDDYAKLHEQQRMEIQAIVEDHKMVIRLLGHVSNEILSPDVFQELIEAKAYVGTLSECAKAVEGSKLPKDPAINRTHNPRTTLEPSTPCLAMTTDVSHESTCKLISNIQTFNVLLLGETQSGKSTFIEAVKKYANPDYTIDFSNIGNAFTSCTTDVIRSPVLTTLPIIKVVEEGQQPIELESLIAELQNHMDYEDKINQRKGLKTFQTNELKFPIEYQFNFFDTPGLNDTEGNDEAHIAEIFHALREAGQIHLVMLTIGKAPFTPGFRAAIRCYLDMFPEFLGIIALVHTHVDYMDLHPARKEALSSLAERKKTLHKMIGTDNCPDFKIDCDLETTRPIRICMTQTIIRDILSLAQYNQPIAMDRTTMVKSHKMKEIDSVLIDKYTAAVEAQKNTLVFKTKTQADILEKLIEKKRHLESLQSDEREAKEYIKEHDTSDFAMIHQAAFDDLWKDNQINNYRLEFPKQKHKIFELVMLNENVRICKESGGEGEYYWEIEFEPHGPGYCMLHAKIYTTRSVYYHDKITEANSRLEALLIDIPKAKKEFDRYSSENESETAALEELQELNKLYTRLISRLSSDSLAPDVFQKLANEKAYTRDNVESPKIIERIYIELVRNEEENTL
ncbi:hypothetical protein BGX27_009654 [Mortierella sp. AM989]|nr:hypothetical protein BGX27_009654 [Mortierella sp. AM989]